METNKTKQAIKPSDKELVITRIFDAPRQVIWNAWTEEHELEQWFAPKEFTTRVEKQDLRPGGKWRYVMVGPDGKEYPSKGVFREIDPPERIVTTDEFDEPWPGEIIEGIVVTTTFDEMGPRTKVKINIVHKSAEDRRKHEEMGVIGGWNSTLDCLDEYLQAEKLAKSEKR
jgi:uncharacterized protein YndB with AHSA1/START domain